MNARWVTGGLVDRIGVVQGWLGRAPPGRLSAGRSDAGLGASVGLG